MRAATKRIWLFVGVLALAGLVSLTPLFVGIRHLAWDTAARLTTTFSSQPLLNETEQNQLATLQTENVRLRAELADYQRLRTQLGTPSFAGFKAIPTALVGRPLDTFNSEFVLSRGAKDGVTLGAPLVINGSTLIGFVTELHQASAVGRLLLHPSTTVTGEVVGDNDQKIQGLVVGDRYTAIRFTTVPRDLELKKDEAVVTTAKPDEVPGGLLIGTIAAITNQQNAAYQEAQLKLPYNPDQLSAVAILVLP